MLRENQEFRGCDPRGGTRPVVEDPAAACRQAQLIIGRDAAATAPPSCSPGNLEKRKEVLHFRFLWLAAIFANLEGFGVFDLGGSCVAVVVLSELRAKFRGRCRKLCGPFIAHRFLP